MDFDKKDVALLDALQQNASRRLEDLAKMIRLAPSSVHDRLRRLESMGLLKKWTVEVNHEALGFGVLAFVGVRADRPCAGMIEPLKAMRGIQECHSVAGAISMILKVRVANTAELMELLDKIRALPGVIDTETTIVLQTRFDRPLQIAP